MKKKILEKKINKLLNVLTEAPSYSLNKTLSEAKRLAIKSVLKYETNPFFNRGKNNV